VAIYQDHKLFKLQYTNADWNRLATIAAREGLQTREWIEREMMALVAMVDADKIALGQPGSNCSNRQNIFAVPEGALTTFLLLSDRHSIPIGKVTRRFITDPALFEFMRQTGF
jgi:hypothetical protein